MGDSVTPAPGAGLPRLMDEEIRALRDAPVRQRITQGDKVLLEEVSLSRGELARLLDEVEATRKQRNRTANWLRIHAGRDHNCYCLDGPDGAMCKTAVAQVALERLGFMPGGEGTGT